MSAGLRGKKVLASICDFSMLVNANFCFVTLFVFQSWYSRLGSVHSGGRDDFVYHPNVWDFHSFKPVLPVIALSFP